jgi:hypothetical protein
VGDIGRSPCCACEKKDKDKTKCSKGCDKLADYQGAEFRSGGHLLLRSYKTPDPGGNRAGRRPADQ